MPALLQPSKNLESSMIGSEHLRFLHAFSQVTDVSEPPRLSSMLPIIR